MPRSEAAWRAEVQAHVPQSRDFVELSLRVPDLSLWRSDLVQDPASRRSLGGWETHIQARKLAVLIERASEEGAVPDAEQIALRLQGCPEDWKARMVAFVHKAPEDIGAYLVYAHFCLVQIVRERRTGDPVWRCEAPSGSSEVLRELMFKWGPRFQRHRWTW